MTSPPPLWVKVCGVTDVGNALAVAAEGVDAIGINLYGPSPRSVVPHQGLAISRALGVQYPDIARVAVVVTDAGEPQLADRLARRLEATHLQLHGDETPEDAGVLCQHGWSVIKALRLGPDDSMETTLARIDAYREAGVAHVLLDARVSGAYGGTGHRIDLDMVESLLGQRALIIAGGLTPSNVGSVLGLAARREDCGLVGVDTASGVEREPGLKAIDAVREFARAARRQAGD